MKNTLIQFVKFIAVVILVAVAFFAFIVLVSENAETSWIAEYIGPLFVRPLGGVVLFAAVGLLYCIIPEAFEELNEKEEA